ncbi:putative Prepilin-type N-terminal cleavage/methylation domain protein [uncultured Desulfobacterium sp.]|uniref:Putative Prepilin-type N-terminal cleavage/methylation domain protein n=1 Tax=uncultured Desulfobacterium sp. TaxID=201089 RepID=A0A445MSS0_9BACT|nr:putative Prepilin-type N-terminal cleavage/methylation domain protein [uncultured Desulfobacterium sp.]
MSRNTKGYTLIELIVVMVLIGLVFSLAAPSFRDVVLTDNLKATTRKLIGLIDNIRNEAIEQHTDQIVFFDLEKNSYWYGPADMTEEGEELYRKKNTQKLPSGARLTEIWTMGSKIRDGEPTIRFFKNGYSQQSAIHIKEERGKREFTLVIRPFLPGVKVVEHYFEFDES